MAITTLQDLWYEELRDLYSAEEQIIAALPSMIKAATHEELRDALESHLEETQEHKRRLEEIAEDHDFRIEGHTCKGIAGILTEGTELLKKVSEPNTKDAAIIVSAQRVEHYEMAAYGTAIAFANELGESDAADMLDETLQEEGDADDKLNNIAQGGLFSGGVNADATDE